MRIFSIFNLKKVFNFLEYFELTSIHSMLDYKPRYSFNDVYNDIRVGNNIWAVKMVELNKAPISLVGTRITKVAST